MDDLMEKIQSVLSDKESLEQIQQLASMLGAPAEGKSGTEQADTASAMPDLSSLAAIKDLASRSAGSDKNIALLLALRPLLKERLLKTTVVYDGTQESPQTDNGIINFRHLQW